ncbi:MAG: isochorismatase family protein [bacterium]|nr:isochorismatase family protein [bacterium]
MNRVLLVVDMQKGLVNRDNYKELSKKIDELIAKCDYDKYVFTKFVNKKGSLFEKRLNWANLKNKDSQSICVKIPENALIIEKYGYGLELKDLKQIKAFGIDSIDVCGLQTDACVYAISLELWDNGIFPNVLVNYTATDPKKEKQAKQMLIHQFGQVDER